MHGPKQNVICGPCTDRVSHQVVSGHLAIGVPRLSCSDATEETQISCDHGNIDLVGGAESTSENGEEKAFWVVEESRGNNQYQGWESARDAHAVQSNSFQFNE